MTTELASCELCDATLTQWEIDREEDVCNACQADPPLEVAMRQGLMDNDA